MDRKEDYGLKVYTVMVKAGYPKEFAHSISQYMNTEWTSQRMCGYIGRIGLVSFEEVADEMLAILSEREKIVDKHILENSNRKYNEYLRGDYREDE